MEVKPPFCSVVILPENNSAPDPSVSTQLVVLAEMPPMTESSTLDHPVTDSGLGNSNSTLVVGIGGGTDAVVDEGEGSVTTEPSVVVEGRVSELQERRRNMHESGSAAAKNLLRISVLAAFARPAKRLICLTFCFAFSDRLTSITLRASTSEPEFDLGPTAGEIE